tara:strand:+ start:4474 stop:5250 length:777 start_codon:yes stop_codon:yes gene_type:complete
MKKEETINHIVDWIKNYHSQSRTKGLVIGVSGGIDSALTSTLAARTNTPVLCIEMPIHQEKNQIDRSKKHIKWLTENFSNVRNIEIDLTEIYDLFSKTMNLNTNKENSLALANTRSRLRMTTLYHNAQINNYLVLGTGNKVEDFGIGFFTKYGDGGVDISPIADLMKSEVYQLSKHLKIDSEILNAPPTDGLWGEDLTDEDQIGANYDELEWAMKYSGNRKNLSIREKEILEIYENFNQKNQHKMVEIPVCKIPKRLK